LSEITPEYLKVNVCLEVFCRVEWKSTVMRSLSVESTECALTACSFTSTESDSLANVISCYSKSLEFNWSELKSSKIVIAHFNSAVKV